MISNRIKFLVVGVALIGATSIAYACDGDKASTKSTSASQVSTEGAGCAAHASATKVAAGDACSAKSAKMASADGCCAKGASAANAMAYGKNTVTSAGTCPAKNEADYSFYVAGAECKGTGSAVAQTVKSVKGVSAVTVDYANHMVYVCADGKTASKQTIEKSLKNAGYDDVKYVGTAKSNCSKSHGKVEA